MTKDELLVKHGEFLAAHTAPNSPFSAYGVECGWIDLLDKLFDYIKWVQKFNDCTFGILQIKNKFGLLVCYIRTNNDSIKGAVAYCEILSGTVCENCGSNQNVSKIDRGWIRTLCENCRK